MVAIHSFPDTSFPRAKGRSAFCCRNAFESSRSRRFTIATDLFGTSTPTSEVPGMGASIRIGCAASARARSFWSAKIRESFTPREGKSVY